MIRFPIQLLICLLGIFALACCSHVVGASVTGSGTKGTETRTVEAFTNVTASGAFQLEVQSGASTASVVIEGDDNIVPLFVTKVSGSTLELHLPSGTFHLKEPLVVRVLTSELRRVQTSGAIDSMVEGITGATFDVQMSGSCKLRARGTAQKFTLSGSGATNVDAFGLEAASVELDLSGSSRSEVNATKDLSVSASGASKVRYKGKPAVKSQVSGSASIEAE